MITCLGNYCKINTFILHICLFFCKLMSHLLYSNFWIHWEKGFNYVFYLVYIFLFFLCHFVENGCFVPCWHLVIIPLPLVEYTSHIDPQLISLIFTRFLIQVHPIILNIFHIGVNLNITATLLHYLISIICTSIK